MYPYYMREVSEPRKNRLEIAAAVAAVVVLLACTMSNVSRPNQRAAAAQATQAITDLQATTRQLQTRHETVEAQVAKIAHLLESTQSDVVKLAERHDTLSTQIAATTAKVQQLEATVQRAAHSADPGALQKIAKERDNALAQAKQRDDRIRQLTLALQKAGVYP